MGRRTLIFLALLISLGGCAGSGSGTIGQENYDEGSTAHGAAFRTDAMHVRKPMKSHADWKPMEFYYKHCSQTGDSSYYSKTSYDCFGPY